MKQKNRTALNQKETQVNREERGLKHFFVQTAGRGWKIEAKTLSLIGVLGAREMPKKMG